MGYRFVKITSYYRDFLKNYYKSNPQIIYKTYKEQLDHLMNQAYAWSNYYSIHLNKIGYEAQEIVCNAEPLQAAWTKENGSVSKDLEIVFDQLNSIKPEVVFFQDSFKFNGEWVTELKKKIPSIKLTIGFCCTNFNDLYLEQFKAFDFVIVCSPHFEKSFKEFGLKVYTIMHAFDASLIERVKINNNYPEADFIFLGSFIPGPDGHDLRQQVVEHLINSKINIELYSHILTINTIDLLFRQSAYISANALKKMNLSTLAETLPGIKKAYYLSRMPQNPKNISLIKKHSKPSIYGIEMFKALSHSKIGFNYHGFAAGDYAANVRLFEVPGVGSCLITDLKKNLNDIFEIDKEVVAFTSAEECVEKVKWLINHPAERKAIAVAGQRRVLKDHTFEIRANHLDEIIRKELNKK